jgi:hypothetical protein
MKPWTLMLLWSRRECLAMILFRNNRSIQLFLSIAYNELIDEQIKTNPWKEWGMEWRRRERERKKNPFRNSKFVCSLVKDSLELNQK